MVNYSQSSTLQALIKGLRPVFGEQRPRRVAPINVLADVHPLAALSFTAIQHLVYKCRVQSLVRLWGTSPDVDRKSNHSDGTSLNHFYPYLILQTTASLM